MNAYTRTLTKVVQINVLAKITDEPIGNATGFFSRYKDKLYLITNYHVLAGLYPGTGKILHKSGAVPGKIGFDFDIIKSLPDNKKHHLSLHYDTTLYDDDDKKLWLEHPVLKNECDVVAYELGEEFTSALPEGYQVNAIMIEKELAYDAKISIMDTVFITGFPMEKSKTYSKFPVYKSGTIGSEPQDMQNGANYYVDSKTKPGMSGSPVIQKEAPQMKTIGDKMQFTKDKINFIGVYSGRAEIKKNEYEAELGVIWPYKEYLVPILEENSRMSDVETNNS